MTNLPSNEFWGRRAGTIHPVLGTIIKHKKWSQPASKSGKPSQLKLTNVNKSWAKGYKNG